MERRKRRNLLSVWLTLVMTLSTFTGILPGSGMTVKAATYSDGYVGVYELQEGDILASGLRGLYGYDVDGYTITLKAGS